MSEEFQNIVAALSEDFVREAAEDLATDQNSLSMLLSFSSAFAKALGDTKMAEQLSFELWGYQSHEDQLPEHRRVAGFASPFPVKALEYGFMDPEELFVTNREKFSEVKLAITQPVKELEAALVQLRNGGVLALQVPASEVTEASAYTDEDTTVHIYILPREIKRILDLTRESAYGAVVWPLAAAARGQ